MHAVLMCAHLLVPATDTAPTVPPQGTGLVIGGSLSLAGAAGFAVAAVVMDHRVRRGSRDVDEALLIAASTTSFVAGVAGVTMVTVGARRRTRALHVSPSLSSTFFGIGLTGAF